MNDKETNNIHIVKGVYEAPSVKRIQIKTNGCFAASQSANNISNVQIESWNKTNGAYTVSGTSIESWSKE